MKSVKVSQRLQDQIPAFIKEEDQSFVDLLVQYYKSQEKSGKPYDILNNILSYTDISSDEYDPNFISSSSIVLDRIGATDQNITVETVDNFLEKDGTIKIDNEIIFYEETTKSPEVVFTPGVNKLEFDKKIQELENIRPLFDGTETSFQLKLLGTPITPSSVEYLRVIINGLQLEPNVDYFLDGSNIRFQTPPANLAGSTTVTKIEYLIGYTSVPVRVLDVINITDDLVGAKILPLRLNTVVYTPLSTVSCLIAVNGVVQEPFTDYTVYNDHLILKKAVSLNDKITVRSVELIAPQFGKGASAIARVSDNKVTDLIVKNGGQDYRINFTPKVTILTPEGVTGKEATAEALVNGIKNVQLIDGGQGYTSANPPVVVFDTPADPSGSIAKATVTVDDATGQVTGINVQSSGSGYDTIPSISFTNAAGATVSDAEIDSEGKVVDGSIKVLTKGLHYTTAPEVYIDAPVDPIGIRASAIAVLDDQSRVDRIEMISPGRGYVTPPRCRIIDPIGAQILDVKVSGGKLTDIQLLTGGSGYNDAPSVYIVDNRKNLSGEAIGGTGATAVATIFNGEITDINITSFGDGYSDTEPPQVFIASPKAAAASCDVGFQEITGFTVHSHGSEYQPSQFKNCKRGVSGVSSYDIRGNQVFTNEAQSIQSSHEVGTSIENLDSLFAKTLYERFVNQFLPDADIDYTTINAPQIVKTIKDFYVSKGTKTATEYLFKILFSENVDVSYPKDELIKPSAATWSVDTIIRVELISGNPVDILDSQLFQYADAVDTTVGNAVCLVENVIAINTGDRTIYELSISEETLEGKFSIPYKTTLVEPLTTTESIITVDSTIGWPERNGIIIMGDSERIQYKEKSLNQFIECTRSKNGIVEDWDSGTPIYSDIFCYINRGLDTEVKLRVLGIAEATGTVLTDTGSYYLPSDKLNVASLGSSSTDQRVTSWLYNVKKLISVNNIEPGGLNNQTATVYTTNNHGLLVGDSVTIYGANPTIFNGTFSVTSRISATVFSYQISAPAPNSPQGNILMSVDLNKGKSDEESINNSIAQFTTNVQNTFFNSNYSYIATTGIPNYKVGPFIGSALLPGNQRKLSRFPRIVDTVSRRDDLSFGPIGCWVNGVAVWSYKSQVKTKFGGITSFDIVDAGEGYDAASKPLIEITGGGGSGAAASVVVNGSLFNVDVTSGGSGYTSSPLVSIVGGGGFGATATAVITNGVVSKVLVETPGQGYTSAPTVSISGGNGTGATATAEVRGPIQSISVDTAGSSYTTAPNIKLNSGEGAVAQPIIINGRIVSIAIINSGSGYTSPPNVIINGDGYGAIAKATIGTFGEDKGRVLSITVENRGIGYSTGLTTIRCESIGQGASFTANVFEWTQNLETELSGLMDPSRGYVFAGYNTQYGGEYAHLSDPKQLRYVLGDNVFKDPSSGNLRELSAGLRHSPIIGWAFDGNPIYGPYGYIDAADQSSGIKRCVSSYRVKPALLFDSATNPNPVRADGPLLSDKPAGTYIEDYEYVFQAGDLDQYNGRYCKTPEYPEGTYAYFVSIDASEAGLPVFPYVCGPQLYSRPDEWNYSQDAVQTNIPLDVVRFRDPYEDVDIDIQRTPNQDTDTLVTEIGDEFIFEIEDTNRDGVISTEEENELNYISEEPVLQLFDYYPSVSTRSQVDIEIDTTTKFEDAKISGFVVENPGISYKVNDKLFFDDTGTGGYGASAKVNAVKGISVSQYTSSMVNDSPLAKITTTGEHDLRVNDEIIVDSIPIIDQTNKTFRVKVVSGVETVNISQQGLGYNDDIPPTYEIVTGTGQDFKLELVQLESGAVNTVNIINSGSEYTPSNPPEVRVSHPQRYKKANYALTLLDESSGIEKIVKLKDIVTADDRTFYVVGEADDVDGDSAGLLAKFNSDGRLLWTRTMAPLQPAAGDKRCVFNRIYLENTSPHSIYVVGETIPNNVNLSYNPDLVVAKYTSGFDAQNNPTAVPVWQREIAGISGSTRRDYITSLTIDDNGQIYVGGTTDTNSPNPDDMWIALLDEQGAIKEKRKICTASGSEQLTDLQFTSDNTCIFVGVNDPAGTSEIVIGETNYDNVTINVSWSRQFGNTGYRFSNPKITIDDYGSRYVTATAYQISNTKNTGVLYMKFAPSDYKTPSVVKLLSPTGVFEDIQSTGVKFDIFGNIDVGAYVKYAFNDHRAIIFKISWNTSNILTAASVKQVSGIGFQPTTISNDNSGDTIIAGNKIESNELAILNFESTITGDETYNNTLTAGWSVDPTLDTSKWKYGAQSANISAAANRLSLDWGADVATNYTIEAWIAIGQAQYNAQSSTPNIFDVTPTTGDNAVVELEGDATSPDFGKVRLKLGSNTYLSTSTTNWSTFNNEAFIHVALVKSTPGVGTYVYKVFINGVEQIDVTSTTIDTQLKSILLFGKSSPVVASSIGGWVDNISVSSIAKYSDTFTPAQAVGSNKTVSAFCYKLDREQTKTGTYTLNTVQTGMQIQVAAAVNDFTFNTQVITSGDWTLGPAGLQILDYADVVSNNVEGTYSFTSTDQIYETRTATIPTPLGRKLLLNTTVIPKFYIRDAIYQSIDTVKTVTFNQTANFTKGSILQQYSVIGGQDVVSAYGTIVNVRGAQGQVDIGNIIGNFDTTKKLKSTANDVNLINQTFLVETTIPQWFTNFSYTTGDEVYNAGKIYTAGSTGVSGASAPIHTIGTVTDGNINWVYTRDAGSFNIDLANTSYSGGTLNQFGSWRPFVATDYSIRIEAVYEGSAFIKGDNIDADAVGLSATFDATGKIITISGLVGVKKFHLTSNLDKDIIPTGALAFTDLVFCVSTSRHNFTQNEIIFVEGFTTTEYGGSFFVEEVLDSRRFLYRLRSTAVQDPSFTSSTIASVNIYAKHPQLLFVRKHQYIFDLDDPSNFGYYMSFSKDNQYKLEYPFVNIVREGIPGLTDQTSPKPLVKFIVDEDVTNISYYFDPSRTLPSNSPVGEASFIDVIETPYKGTFNINQILSDTEFTFPLLVEPEKTTAPLGTTETGLSRASYSTTSLKAIGPIASIKLVNPGGFYQKLPIVTDISSDREIEKIRITSGGTEYINGIYYNVPIAGDGEGGLCNITVADDGELTGVITAVELTSPGKGYTTASIDIDTIPGILGSLLQGSGGQLDVVIPAEGSGASVFLQGTSIGKIKKLKNNEFGFGYSHDYTLRPEITFPVNLQLFNTAILSEIKVTDPGSGYTSIPRVVIEGGGGSGAEAEAIVKNNRLSEIVIKNPGSGYSSEPSVTLKSEFNYVVNLDLGYLQFNFPHGITTGAAVQLRAEDLGSTVGVLPKPSSAGLVSLSSTTTYYAIAGEANSLEADQLRIALTQVDAESGNFITFLTQGDGRQILLTEVFGGQATAIVQTSRFLKGELVYQGSSLETATATGYVSDNEGWQIGPRILKLENYNGNWTVGERVTAQVSRASGLIDNLSIARGTLNIDSMTTTTGQFIDDIGKPSEIVQKIQDSYFYQNFSYVIKSQTPINEWRKSILETNHPVGFNMFGELALAAGKDISGRKVVSDLVKEVNIFSATNINQITSFANSQPIYTEFNNTEVLFRQRRLTNSEEILTSIVKKLDNIDNDFNGVKTQFPLTVEGESVTATDDQLLILINGVAQSPGTAFTTSGPSVVFSEPPKAPSRIKFRNLTFSQINIIRYTFSTTSGIFPQTGKPVRSLQNEGTATVIDSGVDYIDVIDVEGTFQIGDNVLASSSGFDGTLSAVTGLTSKTIYEQGERITNLQGDFAIIEENNLRDGVVDARLVVSRTSGTSEFETGDFNIRFNDTIYSAASKIAARVTVIAPYTDDVSQQIIDTVDLSPPSSFFGLIFQRVPSITYPNTILDNISETVINPEELYEEGTANNQDFLDFEEVRNQEIRYNYLSGSQFAAGDSIRNKQIYYDNASLVGVDDQRSFDAAVLIRKNDRFIAEEAVGLMKAFYPSFTVPSLGGDRDCEDDIVDILNIVAYQLEVDGNSEIWDAASTYVQGNAIYHVDGEVAQTIYAFNKARDLAIQCIRNEVINTTTTTLPQYRDPTITEEFAVISNSHGDARDLILANKWFIAYEALHYAKTQNPGYNVSGGDVHCLSDIVDVLEAMVYNLAHGGNNFVYKATKKTLQYGVTSGDRDTIVNAFTKARDIAIEVMRNNAWTKAGSHNWNQVTDTSITADPANPTCQAVASAITTLMNILITNLGSTASPGTVAAFEAAVTETAPSGAYAGYTNSCVNQANAITSYMRIITDTLEDPTGATPATYQWAITNVPRVLPPYAFVDGETLRCAKHAYQDKSTGGQFGFGDTVKAITSGATYDVIGSNAGNKWIFSKQISGVLQAGEYITNSKLTYANVTQDKLTFKTDSGSLKFTGSGSYVSFPSSNAVLFGDGADAANGDYTIELWIRPASVTGTQRLVDFRESSSDAKLGILMSGSSLRLSIGASDVITVNSAINTVNNWYHIAVSRSTSVTKLFVNGQQMGTYTDTNNYNSNSKITVGAGWNNGNPYNGWIDNLIIYKGISQYNSAFTPPTVFNNSINVSFALLGEAPFPMEQSAVYATYVNHIISTATADEVELWRSEITTEGVDLSREQYRICAEVIRKNIDYIAEEAVGRLKYRYPDFVIPGDGGMSGYGSNVCLRDTKSYIIPAIIDDLISGGNFQTTIVGRAYIEGSGALQHIGGEQLQSIYTWREVAKLCIDVITLDETNLEGTYSTKVRVPNYFASPASSQIQTDIMTLVDDLLDVIGPTGHRFRDGADLIYFNRKAIADEAVYYIENKYQVQVGFSTVNKLTIPNRAKCVRDIRDHILPAIAGDLVTGGNFETQAMIDSYLDNETNINYIEDELLAMIDAIEYAKKLAQKAIQGLLIGRNENPAQVAADFSDYYQMLYTDESVYRDDTITIDPKAYTGSDRDLDAANLLVQNAKDIAGEAVDILTKTSFAQSKGFRVPGGKVNCEDDIVDIIESIAHDLRFGGNSESYDAAALYLNSDLGLSHVGPQSEETTYAFKLARDMCILAIRNRLGFTPYEDEGQTSGLGQVAPRPDYYNNATTNGYYDAANEIENNIRFIATTAVGRGMAQYPGLAFSGGYNYQSCVDDVIDLLEALVFNLKHGGNNRMWYSSEFYITVGNAIQHISNQAAEVKYIFQEARDIATQVMRQEIITVNGVTEGTTVYDGTITVDQSSGNTTITPTNVEYFPTSGNLRITSNGHTFTTNDSIRIKTNSLVFTCTMDGDATNHSYPRITDPAANANLPITATTTNTFTVFVGTTTAGNYAHSFVSAQANAVSVYTGGAQTRCVNEAASIASLMGIPIQLFDSSNTSNPTAYLNGITRTLPLEWPLTGERAIRRDVTITYDSAGNGNCTTQSSAINTLWEILINTITTAAAGNGSHLATITRTAPVTTNTVYKGGTCYDVTSAAHVLFKILLHGLGSGTEMYKQSARLLMYNDTYTRLESYENTLSQYPGYAGDASFAEAIQKAIVYDFITNGNARTLQLINSWFDADGNFVAYPGIFRTRLVYHARMIKELMDHILKGTAPDPGTFANQPLYTLDGTNPDRELRPTATASHKLHQLFHLIMVGLQNSAFPTVYLRTQFDAGVAVSNGVINVANNFEPYDRVEYIVLGSNIAELDGTVYYIHPNSTSSQIVLTEYIDGEPIVLTPGTPSQLHTLAVAVDPGVDRVPTTYGTRDVPTPIKAGFNLADVVYGGTSGATAQIVRMEDNLADIMYQAKYMTCNTFSAQGGGTGIKIQNGETVVVQGATQNTGKVLATDNETYIKLIDYNGTFTAGDTIEGVTSGGTCTFADEHDRLLVNFRQGEFIATDKFFSKDTGSKATALIVRNNNGALIDNQSGRITYDISTVTGEFKPQDVIYGSVTDQIVEIESFVTLPNFGEYVHGRQITRLTYVQLITDTGVTDTFNVGDVLQIQSGGISIGWTVTVTEIDTNSNYVFVANETGTPEGVTISDIASNSTYQLAKVPVGTLFPSVYTGIAGVTITDTTAYGKIAKITQFGTRAVLHLEGTSGTFQKNSQIIGDNGFRGACSSARSLRGRVRRFFRGFDGVQKAFKLTQGNGTQYFPDPAGHMMIFVNGILQPPGADYAFTAFSDNIQFTEAPAIGSTFHGVYKGKLRQLDDISFDFDSLRNSFNLKLNGVFYSLTLTDGVQSNTILPENNIICQLNGVIQEPGIGFEIVGSRIIFSEVPRAGSTFVAFSYVGSDVDVIAATVVPPIEAGDELRIDGEEETRTVALIESSNSLITFEYGGAVKGRNASALAEIEKGRITNAILTNSGDGYSTRPQVDVISSTGFGGRIKALVGVARIDVKNAGQGYSLPTIVANTTVADDFLGPTGPALNGGIDIYDPNFIPVTGGTGVIENFITITESPRNITVNQGQTATFQVAAKVTISNVVAYQINVANKSVNHPYYGQGSGKGYNFTGGQFNSSTEAPTLVFVRGATYQFNQNDVTNATHALYFSEDATAYGGNSRYETGVVYRLNGNQVADYATYAAGFNAATTRSVSITVAADAPATLNYVCGNHQYMGSAINVNNGTLSYQWQKKDYGTSSWNNITGAISSTYTTAATTQADTNDEYRVGITSNGAIPVLSTAAVLTVNIGATTLSSFTPTQIFDDD